MQAKLLRALSEREVFPVGAIDAIPVNIRVIAATHCDLESMVSSGEFRDDLYYRLCGAQFRLPAMRERKDQDWVIEQILERYASKHDVPRPEIDKAAREKLLEHQWPGNLREVSNVIEYAAAVCQDNVITLANYYATKKGWKLPLPDTGERVVAQATIRGGRVVFSSLVPSTAVCAFGGSGWGVDIDVITGNRAEVKDGGGVSIYPHKLGQSLPRVSNCTIHDNTAQGKGGGLYAALHPLAPTPGVRLVGNDKIGRAHV